MGDTQARRYEPMNGCDCEGFCYDCEARGCAMCLADTDRSRPWYVRVWRAIRAQRGDLNG